MKITDTRVLTKLFTISWIVYFTSYIGRLNYAATMIEIGHTEGYTISQLGIVVTALFISYGIGQLISGLLGDYYSSRLLVYGGLMGCALCNLLVFLSTGFWQLVVIWSLNGLALSFVWPPMLKLFSRYMPKDYLHKSCFNIQTSVALGTFFTYIICSSFVMFFNWRIIFLLSAVLITIAATVWYKMIKAIEIYALEYGEKDIDLEESTIALKADTKASFLKIAISSGLMTILIAVLIVGFLKEGIMTWVPHYIIDTFNVNINFSIFLTAFLPLVNLSGIYVIKYINSKNNNDDLKTTILFYKVSMISLILLVIFGKYNIYLAIILFSLVTSCMLGINTILVSILPIYFKGYGKTSLVAGLTNCVTYLGGALCGYGLGELVERYNWNIINTILAGICALGIVACISARPMWNQFKQISHR